MSTVLAWTQLKIAEQALEAAVTAHLCNPSAEATQAVREAYEARDEAKRAYQRAGR